MVFDFQVFCAFSVTRCKNPRGLWITSGFLNREGQRDCLEDSSQQVVKKAHPIYKPRWRFDFFNVLPEPWGVFLQFDDHMF